MAVLTRAGWLSGRVRAEAVAVVANMTAAALRPGVGGSVMEYLPHGGGGNMVAEFDEFALHAPVPPRRISVAMRITSFRIAAAVGGRPGLRRLV